METPAHPRTPGLSPPPLFPPPPKPSPGVDSESLFFCTKSHESRPDSTRERLTKSPLSRTHQQYIPIKLPPSPGSAQRMARNVLLIALVCIGATEVNSEQVRGSALQSNSSLSDENCWCYNFAVQFLEEVETKGCDQAMKDASEEFCAAVPVIGPDVCETLGDQLCAYIVNKISGITDDFANSICGDVFDQHCDATPPRPMSYVPLYTGYVSQTCTGKIFGPPDYPPDVQQNMDMTKCLYGGNLWSLGVLGTCSPDGTKIIIHEYNDKTCRGASVGRFGSSPFSSKQCYYDPAGTKHTTTLMGQGGATYICNPTSAPCDPNQVCGTGCCDDPSSPVCTNGQCYPPSTPPSIHACFLPSSSVTLEDGSRIPISELRIGMSVQALRVADGAATFSPVYTNTHSSSTRTTTFLHITASSRTEGHSNTLHISPMHFLYLQPGGCGSSSNFRLARAKEAQIGDAVIVLHNVSGATTCKDIQRITSSTETGFSSPFTLEGTIIVDGMAASVYSDLDMGPDENHHITRLARDTWVAGRATFPRVLHGLVDTVAFLLVWRDYTLSALFVLFMTFVMMSSNIRKAHQTAGGAA